MGTWYDTFKAKAQATSPAFPWAAGSATFKYPNQQPPTALWFHDHSVRGAPPCSIDPTTFRHSRQRLCCPM